MWLMIMRTGKVLTTSDFEVTFLRVHGKIMQPQDTRGSYGHPEMKRNGMKGVRSDIHIK